MQKQGFFCQLPFDPTHTEIGPSFSPSYPPLAPTRRAHDSPPRHRVHPHQQDHRSAVLDALWRAQENELVTASGESRRMALSHAARAPCTLLQLCTLSLTLLLCVVSSCVRLGEQRELARCARASELLEPGNDEDLVAQALPRFRSRSPCSTPDRTALRDDLGTLGSDLHVVREDVLENEVSFWALIVRERRHGAPAT